MQLKHYLADAHQVNYWAWV